MALKKRIPPSAPRPAKTEVPVQKEIPVAAAPYRPPMRPRVPIKAKPVQAAALDTDKILELINRRQRQIIVHSVIYYRMNGNIITDKVFDTWGRELAALQRDNPTIAEKSVFWEDMKDYDGTTGYHLADHPWGLKIAPSLMRTHVTEGGKNSGNKNIK